MVPCKVCGDERPVKAKADWYVARARQRMCNACQYRTMRTRATTGGNCQTCGRSCAVRADLCRQCYYATKRSNHQCLDCRKPLRNLKAVRCQACYRATLGPVKPPPRPINWDIDEMAVDRLRSGSPVKANPGERRAAARLLARYGLSASQIAERLRVSQRTVERYRSVA